VEPCRSSLRGGDRIFSVEDDIYDRLIDHIYSYRFAAPEMDMEFKVSMAGKANAVIDYLVLKGANAQGELPTQLALMKLLFFVEGWSYPLLGRSLIGEPVKAWRLGPVIVSQRDRLKTFGSTFIPASFVSGNPDSVLGPDETALIDDVWRRYAIENPSSLVGLTHLRGSPWHRIRKMNHVDWDAASDIDIPGEMIRDYFCDLYGRAGAWLIRAC
jgi:uncharacterized phage-associated protein